MLRAAAARHGRVKSVADVVFTGFLQACARVKDASSLGAVWHKDPPFCGLDPCSCDDRSPGQLQR